MQHYLTLSTKCQWLYFFSGTMFNYLTALAKIVLTPLLSRIFQALGAFCLLVFHIFLWIIPAIQGLFY